MTDPNDNPKQIRYCGEFLDIMNAVDGLGRKMEHEGKPYVSVDTWAGQCRRLRVGRKDGLSWEIACKEPMLVEFIFSAIDELEANHDKPLLKNDPWTMHGFYESPDEVYIDLWVWDVDRQRMLAPSSKWSMLDLDFIELG